MFYLLTYLLATVYRPVSLVSGSWCCWRPSWFSSPRWWTVSQTVQRESSSSRWVPCQPPSPSQHLISPALQPSRSLCWALQSLPASPSCHHHHRIELAISEEAGISFIQSINQHIYNAPWYRGACYSADYAETKRNVLSRILNVLTDGAVRQFRGRESQSLGAATEKWRAAVSRLCGGRAFHARAEATGKARSPSVVRRVVGTTSVDVEALRRRRRESAVKALCDIRLTVINWYRFKFSLTTSWWSHTSRV